MVAVRPLVGSRLSTAHQAFFAHKEVVTHGTLEVHSPGYILFVKIAQQWQLFHTASM